MLRTYKKFPNRRLYETTPSLRKKHGGTGVTGEAPGYRTQLDLVNAIQQGDTVQVLAHKTDVDITTEVLLQTLSQHPEAAGVISVERMHQLMRALP